MGIIKLFEQFLIQERSKNDPIPEVYMDKKLAIFLVGAPASGKSFYLDEEILRKNRNFNIIDPDDKSKILTKYLHKLKGSFKDRVKYKEFVNTFTNKIESYPLISGINKEIESQFEVSLKEGTNVIYDSTGNNTKLLTYLIDKCEESGYTVIFLHVMGKNLEWQLNQSKLRANRTGRPVDEEYLIDLYDRSQGMIKYYSKLNIDNYYIIWNRGENFRPKWYKYEDGELKRKSGSTYKPVTRRRKERVLSESNSNVIHAFDMDDTLVDCPEFSDFYSDGKLPSSDSEMGKVIDDSLMEYGLDRSDVRIQNDRITVDSNISPSSWDRNSQGRGIMPKPGGFYSSKESLGTYVYPKIKDIFDRSENNTIITGRNEFIRESVEESLYENGIYPNMGVNMSPLGVTDSDGIANWKSSVISDLCGKYDMVYFYEDKLSWIEIVRDNVDLDNLIIYHVVDGEIIEEY